MRVIETEFIDEITDGWVCDSLTSPASYASA